MLINYLKVAFRSIYRNKLVSLINLSGLVLAFTCGLLIYGYVADELAYDRHHENADRIYRVTRNFLSRDGSVSLHLGHVAPPFGPLLKNDFSDIEETVRVLQSGVLFTLEENGERKLTFDEPDTYFAEPSVFNIFTIPILAGDAKTALERPYTVMISEEMAAKYFGEEDAVGKHLIGDQIYDLEVSGVFKSFPQQSHWHPDFLIAFSTLEDPEIYGREGLETNYGNNAFATYILVNDEFDANKTEAAFPDFIDRHMGTFAAQNNAPAPSTFTNLFLQPLTSIHLHSHLDSEIEANGNISHVKLISVVGIFILLIACFNFINLSTARATRRGREVGLRKVVGAFKNQLVFQFLAESVLMAVIALVVAFVIAPLATVWLNEFTGKSIQLNPFNNAVIVSFALCAAVLVGAVAGLYPAFVLAAFKPAFILKGQQKISSSRWSLRRVLVVSQFSISIVLIIATFVIVQQLRFLDRRELGYAKDQIITLPYYRNDLGNHYDAFREEMLRLPVVRNAGRSSRVPTGRLLDSQGSSVMKGDTLAATDVVIKSVRVDHHFLDTYEIPVLAGRNFSKEIKSDDSLAYILNETAVRMIGWQPDEAVGKVFRNGNVTGQVIGVVKDFHFESLHEEIVPIVFLIQPSLNRLSLNIAGGDDTQRALNHAEEVWNKFLPQWPFEYQFLSETYQQLYKNEQRQSELFSVFSGLALFIASLGLFGLATFNTQQRVKEIGIRKVMGASVSSIVRMLSVEILGLMIVANLVAWPVAWYFMSDWLNKFAYHIDMPVAAYAVAGIAGLLLALLTVSTQTIRAAMTNPVSTLRQD